VGTGQTWIQDLLIQDQDQEQDLLFQDQHQDQYPAISRPRPRPRLWGSKTKTPRFKTKTETCKNESRDQDSSLENSKYVVWEDLVALATRPPWGPCFLWETYEILDGLEYARG